MHKRIKLLLPLLFMAVTLSAEGWRFAGGTGFWSLSADGATVHQADSNLFGMNEELTDDMNGGERETVPYLYVVISHPVHYLPQLRLEYVGVGGSGSITYFTTDLFGATYETTADTRLELAQYDGILFYNVLRDFYWTTIDLGADIKYVRSHYRVPDMHVDSASGSVIPMAYLRGCVEAPFAPIGLESDIKYITDGESTVYDIRIKADYTMAFNDFQAGVEVGYRLQQFTVYGESSNYLGDTFSGKSDTDVTFAGLYGGVNVRF